MAASTRIPRFYEGCLHPAWEPVGSAPSAHRARRHPGAARALVRVGKRREDGIHVGLRRRAPEREPQRAARRRLAEAHREHDVRRLGHAGLARRAGRDRDARPCRAAAAASRPARRGGRGARARAGARPPRAEIRASGIVARMPGLEPVAQRAEARRLGRRARPPRARPRRRTRPRPAASCVPERRPRCWPPPCTSGSSLASRATTSAPTPTGPPSLCDATLSATSPPPREPDRARRLAERQRQVPERADRVEVQRHARLRAGGGCRDDRLQRADLVVGREERRGGGIPALARRSRHAVEIEPRVAVDRHPLDVGDLVRVQPGEGVDRRVVLGRRRDDRRASRSSRGARGRGR